MDRNSNFMSGIGTGATSSGELQNQFLKSTAPKNSKFISLRVGEIVHGTILDIFNDKEVLVQLPVGTMKAALQGRLAKGDQLFFRVAETDPQLSLKIYAISTKIKGVDLRNDELTRILDLPNNQFFSLFLDYIKHRRTLITRDEMLLFFKAFISLSDEELKQEHAEKIFKTLYMMKEASIPLKPEIYTKIKPFFIGEKEILDNFDKIYKYFFTLPLNYKLALDDMFAKMKNPSTEFPELIRFFSIVSNVNESITLFDLMRKIIHIPSTTEPRHEISIIRQSAYNIMLAIEGQNIYNGFAQQNNAMMIFFIPIIHAGLFRFAQLFISKKGKTKDDKLVLKMNINTDTDFSSLIENGLDEDDLQGTMFFSESDKIIAFFNKHIGKIKEYLIKHSFIIENLTINQVGSDDPFVMPSQPEIKPNMISVVI